MKVAIDPGHGMSNRQMGIHDPGAIHVENGFRHEEATIALKYALVLKDVFRAKGHDVFMTRDDAEDHAPVGKRARNAEEAGCEVFISLHLNDFDDDAANGLEVLYRGADDEAFAQELQSALVTITSFKNRGIKKREDLAVLKFRGVAALIELGFIANDKNRETLLNPQKRMAICEAIAQVTMDHFKGAGAGAAAGGGR
jgi:N-acetylmuramoyl-L-alanine amidase